MGLFRRRSSRRNLPPPTYSNDAVIARIRREERVDREIAHAWFGEMLVFLDLCAQSDEVLSPPKNVDKAWHAFLLHSRDYEAYCRERFGRLIHHQPTGEPDPEAYRRAWARRSEHAQLGPADAALWTVPVGIAADGRDAKKKKGDSGGGATGAAACGGASAYGDGGSDSGGGFFGGGDSGGGSGGGDSGGGSSCGGGGCGGGGS